MSSFKQVPASELRAILPKIKRQVQLGKKKIAVSYYGEIVGFLVPLADLERAIEGSAIVVSKDVSLMDFRKDLTSHWESVQSSVDCVYLTYHGRRIAAFVGPNLTPYLPIPVSEVAHKLLSIE